MADNKPSFAQKYSPELQQRIKDRLKVPEIREAMTYWVMQCVEKLGQVKSRKHILGFLLHRLAPHGATLEECEYLLDVALATWENQRKYAVGIAIESLSPPVIDLAGTFTSPFSANPRIFSK